MRLLLLIIVNAVTVLVLEQILSGIEVSSTTSALIVGIILIALNAFLRPILAFLAFPITLITLGLFSLVINAVIILIADALISGFEVDTFMTALIAGIILAIVNSIFDSSYAEDKA